MSMRKELPESFKIWIKNVCQYAVLDTIADKIRAGTNEDDISSSLATRLCDNYNHSSVNPNLPLPKDDTSFVRFEDENLLYETTLQTEKFAGKQEKEIGADFLFIQHRYWGNVIRRKVLLIQAKKFDSNLNLDIVLSKDPNLSRQIKTMKQITPHNFVLLYTKDGIFIKSGNDLLDESEKLLPNWISFCDFFWGFTKCEYGERKTPFDDPINANILKQSNPRLAIIQILRSMKKIRNRHRTDIV